MKYTLTIYRDGELVNTIHSEDELACYKEMAKCYRDLTKHGFAEKGKLTDKMVDGVHVDIFDLYYDSGLNKYHYHYEFDFSLRRE